MVQDGYLMGVSLEDSLNHKWLTDMKLDGDTKQQHYIIIIIIIAIIDTSIFIFISL